MEREAIPRRRTDLVNLEKKVRHSSLTFIRFGLLAVLVVAIAKPGLAQSGSYRDGTRRHPNDQTTQRWLPLPQEFLKSEPPLKQMMALQELQAMLQGAGQATVSDMSEDQLQKMEETFKNWQNNNASIEGLPDLSSIPPNWIDRAIRSPQMRKQAHDMLDDYARKRKVPRANAGGHGRPVLPPTNLDPRNDFNRSLPPRQQRLDNRNPGSFEPTEDQPRNRYQPNPRNSVPPNSREQEPFSPGGFSTPRDPFSPRDSSNPRDSGQPENSNDSSNQTQASDLNSGGEIANPFDMLPEDREEQAKIPNPQDMLPSNRNGTDDGGLNNLLGSEAIQDLFGGEGGRSLDKEQVRKSLDDSGLEKAMRNGAFDELLQNKSFQDAMRSDELKDALKAGDIGGALNSKPMRELLQDPGMDDTLRRMMQEMGNDDSSRAIGQNSPSGSSQNYPSGIAPNSHEEMNPNSRGGKRPNSLTGDPSRQPSEPRRNSQFSNNEARSNSTKLPSVPNAQQEEAIRRLMDQLARDNNLPTSQDLTRSGNNTRSLGGSSPSFEPTQPYRANPGVEPGRRNRATAPRTWDPNLSLSNRNSGTNSQPRNSTFNRGQTPGESGLRRPAADGESGSFEKLAQRKEQLPNAPLDAIRDNTGSASTESNGLQAAGSENATQKMTQQFEDAIRGISKGRDGDNSNSEDPFAAVRQQQIQKALGEQSRAIAESLRSQGAGNSGASTSKNALKDLIDAADPESIKKLVESKGFGNTIQAIVDNTIEREKKGPSRAGKSSLSSDATRRTNGSREDTDYSDRLKNAIDRLAGKSPKDPSKSNTNSTGDSNSDSQSNLSTNTQSSSGKGNIAQSVGGKDKKSGIRRMWSDALKSVQQSPKTASSRGSSGETSGGAGSSVASAASSAANAVGNLEMPSFDGSFLWSLLIFGFIIAGIIIAALSLRRLAIYFDPEQVERRWVQKVLKAGVKTREDVVRAYHNLVLRSSNSVANWWTHRYVAKQLSLEISPQLAVLLQEITNIYEEARYLPPECELDSSQIQCMESAIQQFETAGA